MNQHEMCFIFRSIILRLNVILFHSRPGGDWCIIDKNPFQEFSFSVEA